MNTSTRQVVITDHGFASVNRERDLIEGAGFRLDVFQCRSESDVIERARGADALLVQYAPISSAVIDNLVRCKVIVRYGIGVDNIDVSAARQRGIPVCNVPDYCIDEVADHTLAMSLALIRQLPVMHETLLNGAWETRPPKVTPALDQMTFVTLGYGRTAAAVLDRARSFNFRLAICDPYLRNSSSVPADVSILTFDQVLQQGDVISLHVPLNDETRQMIDESALSRMKHNAILVNTARGGLIDTVALARALENDLLGGAGLDVFETEPLETHHPLRRCKNVLLTPHIAWYSEQSKSNLQKMAAEEVVRGLTGIGLRNRVP